MDLDVEAGSSWQSGATAQPNHPFSSPVHALRAACWVCLVTTRTRACDFDSPTGIREWPAKESAKHALTGPGRNSPPRHPLHTCGLHPNRRPGT